MQNAKLWEEQPGLLAALSLLIGTSSFLFWGSPWNWIWPLLWIAYLIVLRSWASIALVLGGIVYSGWLYVGSPSGDCAYFSITSLQPHATPFQKGFLYKGMLFADHCRVPCSVYHKEGERPPASCDYILQGKLIQRSPYEYLFKTQEWTPVKRSWSLAEFRYQAKERFRKFLDQKLQRPRVATFLGSLITGDVEDRSLRYEFGRLGLQHILAISGFHFGVLISFCSYFLSLIFPQRWKLIALLLAVNLYFLFVGSAPAVQRSWLTALLYLTGKLIGRHSSGLNLLGVALTVEIILDPLISANLGFQLSFLSCAGILLLHPLCERPLRRLLPKRTPLEASALPPFSKHAYFLSAYLREGLAITLAVNIAIFPLLLFYFHQFPLLSLLYNLFFPSLVGIALFSLLIALLTHLLFPPLANLLFPLTDFLTAQLLDLAAYPPLALDYSLHLAIPAWPIPFYILLIFCISMTYKKIDELPSF